MHTGETLLQGIQGAYQQCSNKTLSADTEEVYSKHEEKDYVSPTSCGFESHGGRNSLEPTEERKGPIGAGITTVVNDELHHMEHEGGQ